MITKMNMSGYFVDDETAVEIAGYLEDYISILDCRLKDELDNNDRNELAKSWVEINEICEILKGRHNKENF